MRRNVEHQGYNRIDTTRQTKPIEARHKGGLRRDKRGLCERLARSGCSFVIVAVGLVEEHGAHLAMRLRLFFRFVLQDVIDMDMAVSYSHTGSQYMQLAHECVLRKLCTQNLHEFTHFWGGILASRATRFIIKILHLTTP